MGLIDFFKNKKLNKKYEIGMKKTRDGVFNNLKDILSGHGKVNHELFDELEEIFIMADIGVDTVIDFVEELRNDERVKGLTNPEDLSPIIVDKMFELYLKGELVNSNLIENKEGLSVYLVVGVNGVGKTTSIAKIAALLKSKGKKVLLAAGDTFRAGAIEQLQIWGDRVGCEVISRAPGSDPSSVMFDAIKYAKENDFDVLLCDTAGRLQNKVNLMNELQKIKKVIEREVPNAPHDTLLVIDATTGQNGLEQAKVFTESTNVTGVVLTKLDGTAKGGIVLAIRDKLNIPIKFVGLGEQIDDLEHFDIEQYIYGLFSDLI